MGPLEPDWALNAHVPVLALSRSRNRYAPLTRLFTQCVLDTRANLLRHLCVTEILQFDRYSHGNFKLKAHCPFHAGQSACQGVCGRATNRLIHHSCRNEGSGYRRKGRRAGPTYAVDAMQRILPSLAGLLLAARTEAYRLSDGCASDHRNTSSGSNASPAQESNAREMFPIGVCESQNPQSNEIFTIPFAPSGSGLLRCSCSFARVVASEEPAGSPLAVRPLPGRRYALGFRRNNEMPTPHHKCQGPFDNVEVYLQNAPFPEDEFGHGYQRSLRALAGERAAGSEEKVFHELLRYGGGS